MICPEYWGAFLETYTEEEYHFRYVHDMGMVNSWTVLENDYVSVKSRDFRVKILRTAREKESRYCEIFRALVLMSDFYAR